MDESDPLAVAILAMLDDAPDAEAVSLPRIGKRLGISASVLLRHLALMGSAQIGDQPGPGWVHVARGDDRWMVCLTKAGRAMLAAQRGGSAPGA